MRILVFSTDDFLPPAGGAETAFWEIARRNPQHQFTLVCARLEPGRSRRQLVDQIEILRIGVGNPIIDTILLWLCGAFVGLAMHWRHRYDLVWAVMASSGAGAATAFHWLTGVPFLLTLQEGNDVDRGLRAFGPFLFWYRFGFRAATGLQAISQHLLDWGLRMGFRPERPHQLIPNGVDASLFSIPDSASVAAERARYGFPEESFIITTISRLVPKNGIGDLIGAVAKLPSRFCLAIYGYGPLQGHLSQLAAHHSVADRVRFLGPLERERLPIVLRAADAFCRPSLTEGLGTAFLEAMATGALVIATPVGGIVDFLRDGENGFFAHPGDPDDLAKTIERVAALNLQEQTRIRRQAQETVQSRYQWDDIARQMNDFFTFLCRK